MVASVVCFVVCHTGPADHFATFGSVLKERGIEVEYHGNGPALRKLQDLGVKNVMSFDHPQEVIARCDRASVVMTDVGHEFDMAIHEGLSHKVCTVAYYDNPEPFVPGGYSEVAEKVKRAASQVLYANANLAQGPNEIGLGYYPTKQAEEVAQLRGTKKKATRAQFFTDFGLEDKGQKLVFYMGGNNQTYFDKALPAFLSFLGEVNRDNTVIVMQHHPAGKIRDRDIVDAWKKDHRVFPLYYSERSSFDAQVAADGVIYYQTSMSAQFILAHIPTIHVGHEKFDDIVVRNGLCFVATDQEMFEAAFRSLDRKVKVDPDKVKEQLGLRKDWEEVLLQLVRGQNE